jgi:hypothetical protein
MNKRSDRLSNSDRPLDFIIYQDSGGYFDIKNKHYARIFLIFIKTNKDHSHG